MLRGVKHAAAVLADRVRRDAKAVGILIEWLGSGGEPVPFDLANNRASACLRCPKNKPNTQRVENSAAEIIRRHDMIRNATQLRTNHDTKLHNCEVCGCYLKLKVWVPLEHIPDESEKFPDNCWIKQEFDALKNPKEPTPTQSLPIAPSTRKIIKIKREAAFGDVIQASITATKLHDLGYQVWWRSNEVSESVLHNHPHIDRFIQDKNEPVDVNLDATYENNLERKSKSLARMFIEASDHQLKKIGVAPLTRFNTVPTLALTEGEIEVMRKRLESIPRPIVTYIPKSGFWKARQINPTVVNQSASQIKGSVVWGFPSKAPSSAFFDIEGPKTFRELMALVYHSDLVVTPDTGPLHVAAAFNRPIVVVEQCIRSDLRLTMQSDWKAVHAPLKCVPCGEFICPIDKDKPPCQNVPAELISEAANRTLETIKGDTVSAIIPVYKEHTRLDRCIAAAFTQCKEVIVALDGTAQYQENKQIIVAKSTGERTGFGKTCMRGAHQSNGSFILFLNDDCYLKPGCVEAMVKTMKRDPKVAVVGAQLWYPDGTIQHGGTFRNNGDIGFGHRDWKKKVPSLQGEHEMEFVTFACALVRRSAFYQVRGFDEEFDTYCEDSDLCLRLKQAGWKIIYNANAKAIHDESQTTAPMKSQLHNAALNVFERKWTRYFHHNPAPK